LKGAGIAGEETLRVLRLQLHRGHPTAIQAAAWENRVRTSNDSVDRRLFEDGELEEAHEGLERRWGKRW
jgi:hypothetical protein